MAQAEHTVGGGVQLAPVNKVLQYTFDSLPLQRGGLLAPVTLAYETW